MAVTVMDALLQAARELEALWESFSTVAGSATTLIDATLPLLGFNQDDELNEGRIFFMGNASTAEADKVTRRITDYAQATGTITFTPSVGVNNQGSGLHYGVVNNRYPFGTMISKLNAVLRESIREEAVTDILSTGAKEYALLSANKVLRVLYGNLGASEENWQPVMDFKHIEDRLWFKIAPPKNQIIRVVTLGYPVEKTTDSELIQPAGPVSTDDRVDLGWIAVATAVKLARWRLNQTGADQAEVTALLNDLLVREQRARINSQIFRPQKAVQIFPWAYAEE